jgi:hypothetical protein
MEKIGEGLGLPETELTIKRESDCTHAMGLDFLYKSSQVDAGEQLGGCAVWAEKPVPVTRNNPPRLQLLYNGGDIARPVTTPDCAETDDISAQTLKFLFDHFCGIDVHQPDSAEGHVPTQHRTMSKIAKARRPRRRRGNLPRECDPAKVHSAVR